MPYTSHTTQQEKYEKKKSHAPPPVTKRTQTESSRDAGGFGNKWREPRCDYRDEVRAVYIHCYNF